MGIAGRKPDASYFAARASEERAAAREAACDDVRAIHIELAQSYRELSRGFGRRRLDAYESWHLLPIWE